LCQAESLAIVPGTIPKASIVADSAAATGLKYQAPTVNTVIDAEGDLLVGDTADTIQRLAIGSNAQVLTVDTAVDGKIKWATPAGGGGKVLQVVSAAFTAAKSTTSTTYQETDITATITPSSASSKIFVIANHNDCGKNADASNGLLQVRLMRGATAIANAGGTIGSNNVGNPNLIGTVAIIYLDEPNTTSATTYKTQFKSVNGGSGGAIINNSGEGTSTITLMEIGA